MTYWTFTIGEEGWKHLWLYLPQNFWVQERLSKFLFSLCMYCNVCLTCRSANGLSHEKHLLVICCANTEEAFISKNLRNKRSLMDSTDRYCEVLGETKHGLSTKADQSLRASDTLRTPWNVKWLPHGARYKWFCDKGHYITKCSKVCWFWLW